jgi:hypothetical protein
MRMKTSDFFCAACALAGWSAARDAAASQATTSPPPKTATFGTSAPSPALRQLPAPQAAKEAPPPVSSPNMTAPGLAEQAGIGSTHAYATAGVLEIGGFANFTGANNFTSIQVSPTAGFFILDNFELSAILGINYVHQTFNDGQPNEQSDHKTVFRILAEPSYHLPFSRTLWGFLGVGLGLASVPRPGGGTSTGFDLAPRLGANFLVGRSGLLSPAVFVDYTTGESVQTNGGSLLGVSTTYGIQAGYTVML